MGNSEKKNKFVELRAKGMSFENIAKELGICKQTCINWSKDLEFQVNNLKAIEMEALQEKYDFRGQFSSLCPRKMSSLNSEFLVV